MYPHLFVFDMIGTTVAPSDAIPEAFREALREADVELTDAQIASVRGKSKRAAIAELLPAGAGSDELENVYQDFRSRLDNHYRSSGVEPIEGAGNTFEWCRTVGARVALATGFDSDIAGLLLDSLGWGDAIDVLVCNDDVPEGRPAPFLIQRAMAILGVGDPGAVASVGDTVSDLQAAVNAAAGWNFAMLSGAHDEKRLKTVAGVIILPSVALLPAHDWD